MARYEYKPQEFYLLNLVVDQMQPDQLRMVVRIVCLCIPVVLQNLPWIHFTKCTKLITKLFQGYYSHFQRLCPGLHLQHKCEGCEDYSISLEKSILDKRNTMLDIYPKGKCAILCFVKFVETPQNLDHRIHCPIQPHCIHRPLHIYDAVVQLYISCNSI